MKRALFQRAMAACAVLRLLDACDPGLPGARAGVVPRGNPCASSCRSSPADRSTRLRGSSATSSGRGSASRSSSSENKAGASGVVGADFVARAPSPMAIRCCFDAAGGLSPRTRSCSRACRTTRLGVRPGLARRSIAEHCCSSARRGEWTAQRDHCRGEGEPRNSPTVLRGIGTTSTLTGVLFVNRPAPGSRTLRTGFPPVLVDVIAGRVDACSSTRTRFRAYATIR